MMRNVDVAVVGGGPAGLAAALAAHKAGARSVLVLERDAFPGRWAAFCSSASTTALACTISARS